MKERQYEFLKMLWKHYDDLYQESYKRKLIQSWNRLMESAVTEDSPVQDIMKEQMYLIAECAELNQLIQRDTMLDL